MGTLAYELVQLKPEDGRELVDHTRPAPVIARGSAVSVRFDSTDGTIQYNLPC